MPTSPDGDYLLSDADLGALVLAGWERLSRAVAEGPRRNRRLAEHHGLELWEIEHLRDTRNRVAHPGPAIDRHDLEQAVAIIESVAGPAPAADEAEVPRQPERPEKPAGPRYGEITIRRDRARFAEVRKLVMDDWAVALAVVLGLPAVTLIAVLFGPVGLLVSPLVIGAAVIALPVVAWLAGWLATAAAFVHAIVQFIVGDQLEACLSLAAGMLIGAVMVAIAMGVG